jgi:hypothetical protein
VGFGGSQEGPRGLEGGAMGPPGPPELSALVVACAVNDRVHGDIDPLRSVLCPDSEKGVCWIGGHCLGIVCARDTAITSAVRCVVREVDVVALSRVDEERPAGSVGLLDDGGGACVD